MNNISKHNKFNFYGMNTKKMNNKKIKQYEKKIELYIDW